MANPAGSQEPPSRHAAVGVRNQPALSAFAGGPAGPALLRKVTCLPSVRRKRMEVRDTTQVEEAMYLPQRLLLEPHPRHLGSTLDKLGVSFDRGRICIVEDLEVKANRAAAAEVAKAIRELPCDHIQWAASNRRAEEEEEVFKELRAIHEARRPLIPEDQRRPLRGLRSRGGCGLEACARARGDPELLEVTTAAPTHACGPGPCFQLDYTPRRGGYLP